MAPRTDIADAATQAVSQFSKSTHGNAESRSTSAGSVPSDSQVNLQTPPRSPLQAPLTQGDPSCNLGVPEYNIHQNLLGLDNSSDDTENAGEPGCQLDLVPSADCAGTVFVTGEIPVEDEPIEPMDLPESLKAKIVDARSFEQIPIIDISKDESTVLEQLRYACEVVGFMQVVGHDVPEELLDRHTDFHRRFFELPDEVKHGLMLNAKSPVRGYFGIGGEDCDQVVGEKVDAAEGQRIRQQSRKDNKEALDMNGVEWSQPVGDYVAKAFGMPSQFPEEGLLPGFKDTMLEYNKQMFDLSKRLLGLMAKVLGLPSDYFERHLTRPVATHRLLHYWPIRDYKTQIGAGEHTDYGLLTILRQDSTGGLQALNAKDSKWVHAPPIDGAFVINLGDMMQRWSGNKFKATIHRVVNTSPYDRFSSPYFLQPNMETVIVPGELLLEGENGTSGSDAQTSEQMRKEREAAKTSEEILGNFCRACGHLKDYGTGSVAASDAAMLAKTQGADLSPSCSSPTGYVQVGLPDAPPS